MYPTIWFSPTETGNCTLSPVVWVLCRLVSYLLLRFLLRFVRPLPAICASPFWLCFSEFLQQSTAGDAEQHNKQKSICRERSILCKYALWQNTSGVTKRRFVTSRVFYWTRNLHFIISRQSSAVFSRVVRRVRRRGSVQVDRRGSRQALEGLSQGASTLCKRFNKGL